MQSFTLSLFNFLPRYNCLLSFYNVYIFIQIAYVENMDSDSLFESLYAEDTEGKKLAEFPAINELIDRYPL